MPTVQIVEDEIWKDRIASAHKYYKKWEDRFECKKLEQYYESFQHKQQKPGDDHYVINKIYETVQIKIDSFIPDLPKFLVEPLAGNSDYDLEVASLSSQLKEDVLNTTISNPDVNFSEEMGMAYKDSFFRFGLLEVGYYAEWVMNPNAPRPGLNTDSEKQASGSKPTIKNQPSEIPVEERIYYKHIPASTFRVGGIDHKYLNRCGWCGYFEWVDKNDLLALRGLKNRKKLESMIEMGTVDNSYTDDKTQERSGDSIKIWHIWDNKFKNRLIVVDSPCITIYEKPYKRLNLFDYRPDKSLISNGFYPIPPVHHWISAQNETNETREQLRNHRRRFIRKFGALVGAVEDDEIEKFEHGEDGTVVKFKKENAIFPIQNAELGPSLDKAIVTSADDLNGISGTSSEARLVADRTTATQANIVNQRSGIRENAERNRVIKWFAKVGRETLLIIRERFTLGVWAKLTTDSKESFLGEIQENKPAYDWVTSEQLNDGYDFRIRVDVTSLSAATQELEKRKFIEFISLMTQFPQIGMSPILVREAAYRCGYRNEKAIKEAQKMALLQQYAIQQQMQVPQNGNAAQNINNSNTPNDMTQIQNQLTNQLGLQ